MSKTVDEFLEKFKSAVAAAPWSSATGYDARRAGIAAVVSALRDELYLAMGPGARWTPREVEIWFDDILGSDAGAGKVAGGSTREDGCSSEAGGFLAAESAVSTPATDLATAVCEWTRADKSKLLNLQWWNVGCSPGQKREGRHGVCSSCGKPIKFTEAKT